MSVEVPPAEEEREKEKSVDELLWDLLVGADAVRVDPISGEVEPAPQESS